MLIKLALENSIRVSETRTIVAEGKTELHNDFLATKGGEVWRCAYSSHKNETDYILMPYDSETYQNVIKIKYKTIENYLNSRRIQYRENKESVQINSGEKADIKSNYTKEIDIGRDVPYPGSYFEGLDKIKLSALVMAIGSLLSVVSFFLHVIAIIAIIVFLVVIFAELLPGFKLLKESDEKYSIGLSGIHAMVLALVIIFFSVIILFVNPILGLIGLILSLIIFFVAGIMLAIGLFRIGSAAGNGLMEVGAILVIFILFVGWILVYISIGEIEERAEKLNDEALSSESV